MNNPDLVDVLVGGKVKTYAYPKMLDLTDEQIKDGNALFKNNKTALFSEPGCGKTLTALFALSYVHSGLIHEEERLARVLIVVPNIAVRNWIIWTASMLTHMTHLNNPDDEIQVIKKSSEKISEDTSHLIVTYGMLSRKGSKIVDYIHEWNPDVIILDESDNLNGLGTTRTNVVYGDAHTTGLVYRARWVWPLTGTPIKRYADDLFPVLRALHSGVLKLHDVMSKEKFFNKFCVTQLRKFPGMHFPKRIVVSSKNMSELNFILYNTGIAIRRTLAEIAPNLPQIRERIISVDFDPSPELKKLTEEAMAKSMEMDEFGNIIDISSVAMTLAQQMLAIEKVPSVCEYLEQVQIEKKAVGDTKSTIVLFWHREVGRLLFVKMHLLGYKVAVISGSTTSFKREQAEDDFNDGYLDFLFGQIAAMGVSLNLQHGGNRAVFAERSWSDASNQQAFSRVFRMGQDSNVLVDYLISDSPLEEPRTNVLKRKRVTTDKVVDGM